MHQIEGENSESRMAILMIGFVVMAILLRSCLDLSVKQLLWSLKLMCRDYSMSNVISSIWSTYEVKG